MLINSQCVAEAPSRRVATAGSRRSAGFGLGAVVRVRGRGDLGAGVGPMSGIWGGADKAAGYLPGFAGSLLPGQLAANPAQPSTSRARVVTKSAVQNSTDKHNTIQVTRLVPAGRGEVGPHPVREPGPA
jgi:hypothetical protein